MAIRIGLPWQVAKVHARVVCNDNVPGPNFSIFVSQICASLPFLFILLYSIFGSINMESLFDRCPVLPPDASISLARYLNTSRQTQQNAVQSETSQPFRACLLHIRVLQLICKTIPSHPEYALAENADIVGELNEIAHRSFAAMEHLSAFLDNASRKTKLRNVFVARGVFDLFARIAYEFTGKAVLGLLAGHVEEARVNITALIIPSQTVGAKVSEIRYESDVSQLLGVKGLSLLGVIHHHGTQTKLPGPTEELLRRYSERIPEAFGVIAGGTDANKIVSVGNEQITDAAHVIVDDGLPVFKLYDLRPVALARDQSREQ